MMMMKTAVAIRHLAFEDLGAFEPVIQNAGYQLRYHDVGLHSFAALREQPADLLFVLGGPIGAYEDDRYPFLTEELSLIDHRLKEHRPLVGICLGAQLIARVLGAKVYPGPAKEIGFAPIELTAPRHRIVPAPFSGNGRPALARRYVRSSARRDPSRFHTHLPEPGILLWPKRHRLSISSRSRRPRV